MSKSTQNHYPWKRSFHPKGKRPAHSTEFYQAFAVDSYQGVPLEQVSYLGEKLVSCLVILGEPGIGKSTALNDLSRVTVPLLGPNDTLLSSIDLRTYGSEVQIDKHIFGSEKVEQWKKSKSKLFLFLDGLDEALLRSETVVYHLIRRFESLDSERLLVRITCRTADWREDFEVGLSNLWNQNFAIYELNRLTFKDVAIAAQYENIDDIGFWDEVQKQSVEAFATKPITLRSLLNSFKKYERLPDTKSKLYENECMRLCEETSTVRRRSYSRLTTRQKFLIASRIGFATVLGNKYSLWLAPELGDAPDEAVTLSNLVDKEISEKDILETINSGLFVSRGDNQFGWDHQTFAEYLATYYILSEGLSTPQILSLITSFDGKIVPQLLEITSWLAEQSPEVFAYVVKSDPQALVLHFNQTELTDQVKFQLTRNLLKMIETGDLVDDDLQFRKNLHKLTHPQLHNQLRPFIKDKAKNRNVRRVATDIAERCGCTDVLDVLTAVVLDQTDDYMIRHNAAAAIWQIGDEHWRSQLKPLIYNNTQDEYDELKGYVLLALWPDLLTAEELFEVLTLPKRPNFIGGYHQFLNRFVEHLKIQDIPIALEWVLEHNIDTRPGGEEFEFYLATESIAEDISWLAWENLDHQPILSKFASVVVARMLQYKPPIGYKDGFLGYQQSPHPFRVAVEENPEKRRLLTKTILPMLFAESIEPSRFVWYTGLVLPDDLDWLLQQWLNQEAGESQEAYLDLIESVFIWSNDAHLRVILSMMDQYTDFYKRFSRYLGPIAIDSKQADQLRARHKMELEYRKSIQDENEFIQVEPVTPTPVERIISYLDNDTEDNWDNWWKITVGLNLNETESYFFREIRTLDLRQSRQWENFDKRDHQRIIDYGYKYLLNHEPESEDWLYDTERIYFPIIGGLKAFWLLLVENPLRLDQLPEPVWEKWVTVIIGYGERQSKYSNNSDNISETYQSLVAMTFNYAPDETILATEKLLQKQKDEEHPSDFCWIFEKCWDDQLLHAFAQMLLMPEINPVSYAHLLEALLKFESGEAIEIAQNYVKREISNETERSKVLNIIKLFIMNMQDIRWNLVEKQISLEKTFGEQLIEKLASFDERKVLAGLERILSARQLADFYAWLESNYPSAEDPQPIGVHRVSSREEIASFRNSLLTLIQGRGDVEAIDAIEYLMKQFPEHEWLSVVLFRTKAIARQNLWQPAEISELFELANDQDKRLVRNEDDLQELVLNALEVLQKKVQRQETPAVKDVWDRQGKQNLYMPYIENDLSDYIKRFLEGYIVGRGLVINREVEVRHGMGGTSGQLTDIHVVVPTFDATQDIKTIIEVKGCWHPQLRSAMETQLLDRYLKPNGLTHGIYLAGWFQSQMWDDSDSRKSDCSRYSFDELANMLDEQAEELSDGIIKIKSFILDASLK